MSLIDEFMKDATPEVTEDDLRVLSGLAQRQKDLEKAVKELESAVSKKKEELREVQEYLIPNTMASVGITEFKLTSGDKITIKQDIYASIKKDFVMEACDWLEHQGLGGVIKDQVTANFGKGDTDIAKLLVGYCNTEGISVIEKMSVHPQTLKALVKEQLAQGIEFPEEYFSVAPINKAIIKGAK